MNRIYLDNAATTRITEPVLEAMLPYLTEVYGNPSSQHAFGRAAKSALDRARRQAAQALGAQPGEIYFTGCGTESDNWALRGTARHFRRGRVIVSAVEHHAILHTCDQLASDGFDIAYLPVDDCGRVSPEALSAALTDDTFLVSVMTANNEVGAIQPVRALSDLAHACGALFHTDAVQAVGCMPLDVNALGVDMLSVSGHKLHAPKGVGLLYVREGTPLSPFLTGGEQEKGQRGGTENLASIVAFGKALELAVQGMDARTARIRALRDRLIDGLTALGARLNGPVENRLPGNVNVSFPGISADTLLMRLDMAGVAASSGSACMAGSSEPSHVLRAMGRTESEARESIRLSLGDENTVEEVEQVIALFARILPQLR